MSPPHALSRADYERELDMTLSDSFPASDPPPWTFGVSTQPENEVLIDRHSPAHEPINGDGALSVARPIRPAR